MVHAAGMGLAAFQPVQTGPAIRPHAIADDVLDYAKFAATPPEHTPFAYLVVPGFVRPDAAAAAGRDFPDGLPAGVLPAPFIRWTTRSADC